MEWSWQAALVLAAAAALAGWCVPALVARLPEPPDPDPEKTPYADLAGAGTAVQTAAWSGLVAGLVGGALGWSWPLLYLVPLVPVGVALAWVDLRTRLLPKLVVGPCYLVVLVLLGIVTAITGDLDALGRAFVGWLVAGGLYWLLWRFTPGMGYGDVRLSGVLGLVLAHLGWAELAVGIYAGFVVGVVGWLPLRLLGITRDRSFPFGPFMLVGAVIGIVWGADLAGRLG
ncbi:A24 family peptidase [Nocardioides sp. AE5]|uniref:A24 family peptidase n=1 Tax=Nocardioides sp. AE5 TaxID=2962573 RepID=UPI002880C03B|nr:A24 family peptidase [Nocardioides sp. AE5]MDT0201479.1 A24 family peptidase [Nocardioides sp. AE5]